MRNAELEQLMEQINSKYAVDTVPVKIGDKVLKVVQIKNYEEYIADLIESKNTGFGELPFWSKIWEASLLLAYFLGKQPVVLGQRILEIGAGLGIVGIYAALCGHRVTITDMDDDALLFARANALLNGVPNAEVRKLDWSSPDLSPTYDVIAGSEVVYDRSIYSALVEFLRRTLAPAGTIFLAQNAQLNAPTFFIELVKYFEFKHTVQKIRLDGEPQKIALYAIRHKQVKPGERAH